MKKRSSEARQVSGEARRQILVEFDPHGRLGTAETGRSSSAETAAKAITPRIASSLNVGKSASISSGRAPSARLASTVRTATRVPLMISSPPPSRGARRHPRNLQRFHDAGRSSRDAQGRRMPQTRLTLIDTSSWIEALRRDGRPISPVQTDHRSKPVGRSRTWRRRCG